MYSLKQIYDAVECVTALGGDKEEVVGLLAAAMENLKESLNAMDKLQVCGKFHIDTLLGCMMGIEALIGEDGENNG